MERPYWDEMVRRRGRGRRPRYFVGEGIDRGRGLNGCLGGGGRPAVRVGVKAHIMYRIIISYY